MYIYTYVYEIPDLSVYLVLPATCFLIWDAGDDCFTYLDCIYSSLFKRNTQE